MTLPSSLKERVLEAAKREPSPTRAEYRAQALRALAIGVAAALLIFFVTGGPDAGKRSPGFFAMTALLLCALSVVVTLIAVRGPSRSMTGAPTELLIGAALLSAPALWVIELGARLAWPQPFSHSASLQSTLICHACTLAMALGPLVALMRLRRHADAVHPMAAGAAFGATAGVWGAVLIDLHCASSDLSHIAWGHALPTLVLAGLGAWIGAKSLALRSA